MSRLLIVWLLKSHLISAVSIYLLNKNKSDKTKIKMLEEAVARDTHNIIAAGYISFKLFLNTFWITILLLILN